MDFLPFKIPLKKNYYMLHKTLVAVALTLAGVGCARSQPAPPWYTQQPSSQLFSDDAPALPAASTPSHCNDAALLASNPIIAEVSSHARRCGHPQY